MKKILFYLFLMAVLLTNACEKEKPTEEEQKGSYGSGAVSFTYSGEIDGIFSVSGSLSATQNSGEGSGGYVTTSKGYTTAVIFGAKWRSGGKVDEFVISLSPQTGDITPGTYSNTSPVNFGLFLFARDLNSFTSSTDFKGYVMISGSIEVIQYTSERIKGTFEGLAAMENGGSINISDGNFDVLYVKEVPSDY
ncbi:MAG: hypothetical protein ACE5QV_00585 [Fidelibacterota bacterium]